MLKEQVFVYRGQKGQSRYVNATAKLQTREQCLKGLQELFPFHDVTHHNEIADIVVSSNGIEFVRVTPAAAGPGLFKVEKELFGLHQDVTILF